MNNRGFGFIALFGFIAFVGIVLIALYMFLTSVLRDIYMPSKQIPNYKNEYTGGLKYEKENI